MTGMAVEDVVTDSSHAHHDPEIPGPLRGQSRIQMTPRDKPKLPHVINCNMGVQGANFGTCEWMHHDQKAITDRAA